MRHHPPIYSLRAEDLSGNYSPLAGDYPVRLLTRRVYSLSADRISESRAHAPMRVSCDREYASRPPC
ncbi:MAG: hypothetical protein AB7O26_10580 [Planctomycetaceae bacterium]